MASRMDSMSSRWVGSLEADAVAESFAGYGANAHDRIAAQMDYPYR